ncbi:hypothetical protein BDV12DRAFT_177369 [Aspergillus spectabilis]
MDTLETPDWLRATLILLTALSFAPQLYRIWSKADSTGVSLVYTLLNLICATEQLTILLFFAFPALPDYKRVFVHDPLTTGDWLNSAQLGVTWFVVFTLFTLTVHHAKATPKWQKYLSIALYALFFTITLLPVLLDNTTPLFDESHANFPILAHDIFMGVHVLFIHPSVLIATICSLSFALWAIFAGPFPGLSVPGLAAQAVVFALLAVSWGGRIFVPQSGTENLDPNMTFFHWYRGVGWFCTDSAVFAGMQGVLFVVEIWKRMGLGNAKGGKLDAGVQLEGVEREEEVEPLLDERELVDEA